MVVWSGGAGTSLWGVASRRRHMRGCGDWSSDVGASDRALVSSGGVETVLSGGVAVGTTVRTGGDLFVSSGGIASAGVVRDRKSVVEGKSVDLGGRRIIKKKNTRSSRGTANACAGNCTRH